MTHSKMSMTTLGWSGEDDRIRRGRRPTPLDDARGYPFHKVGRFQVRTRTGQKSVDSLFAVRIDCPPQSLGSRVRSWAAGSDLHTLSTPQRPSAATAKWGQLVMRILQSAIKIGRDLGYLVRTNLQGLVHNSDDGQVWSKPVVRAPCLGVLHQASCSFMAGPRQRRRDEQFKRDLCKRDTNKWPSPLLWRDLLRIARTTLARRRTLSMPAPLSSNPALPPS